MFETTLTRARVEKESASGNWHGRLLNDYLQEAARRKPNGRLVDSRGSLTFAELVEVVDDAALGLVDVGVQAGDVVMVQLPNWIEFVIVTLAIERIGAVINPVAPVFRAREVQILLELAQPAAIVTTATFRKFDHRQMFDEVLRDIPSSPSRILVDGTASGWIAWGALLDRGRERRSSRTLLNWMRMDPNAVSELIFTSGTTGQPKGVMHTPNTLACAAAATIAGQGLSENDVCHMASTFAHQTGFVYGIHLPIHLGASTVYQDIWSGENFVDLVEAHGISFTMGATPFAADFLRALADRPHKALSLRTFICAGAPVPKTVAIEMKTRVNLRLATGWGMTENCLVTALMPGDPVDRIGSSDGRSYPGMEIVVRDAAGLDLSAGCEGDLFARGPFTFVGYLQGRVFTETSFAPDDWFMTGDRAQIDVDGFLRITGRSKDIIIRGGENIPVTEIEDIILRHPAVRQVALVATSDDRMGERVCACVLLEEGAHFGLDDLRAHMRGMRVTPQFWPERLELMTEFPTTPSGKVQKAKLRELVQETPG